MNDKRGVLFQQVQSGYLERSATGGGLTGSIRPWDDGKKIRALRMKTASRLMADQMI